MLAVVYRGAGRTILESVAEPAREPGGLLVEMTACGICGSDLMDWYQDRRAPVVLGHEPVGRVLAADAGGPFAPGQRVFVHHHVPCGRCALCAAGRETLCPRFRATSISPGGLAERFSVPAEIAAADVLALPDDLDDITATLIEPLACALRGQRRAGIGPGIRLAIVGAGAMGLLEIAAARAAGVESIVAIEPRPERRARAAALGAATLAGAEPEAVRALAGGLADVVIVCTASSAAITASLSLAAPGARVQLFAPPPAGQPVGLDLGAIWFSEVTIESTYSAGPADTRAALELLRRGAITGSDLISHRLPLERGAEAIAVAREAHALKVVVERISPPP